VHGLSPVEQVRNGYVIWLSDLNEAIRRGESLRVLALRLLSSFKTPLEAPRNRKPRFFTLFDAYRGIGSPLTEQTHSDVFERLGRIDEEPLSVCATQSAFGDGTPAHCSRRSRILRGLSAVQGDARLSILIPPALSFSVGHPVLNGERKNIGDCCTDRGRHVLLCPVLPVRTKERTNQDSCGPCKDTGTDLRGRSPVVVASPLARFQLQCGD